MTCSTTWSTRTPLRRARCARTPLAQRASVRRGWCPQPGRGGNHHVTISEGSPSWRISRLRHSSSFPSGKPSRAAIRGGGHGQADADQLARLPGLVPVQFRGSPAGRGDLGQGGAAADETALALLGLDPAFLPQHPQRPHHGRPGDPELARQLVLAGHQRPRRVLPVLDPPLQLRDHLRVLRRRVLIGHERRLTRASQCPGTWLPKQTSAGLARLSRPVPVRAARCQPHVAQCPGWRGTAACIDGVGQFQVPGDQRHIASRDHHTGRQPQHARTRGHGATRRASRKLTASSRICSSRNRCRSGTANRSAREPRRTLTGPPPRTRPPGPAHRRHGPTWPPGCPRSAGPARRSAHPPGHRRRAVGSDAPPWSPISTRTDPSFTQTATSNAPPSPEAVCVTAFDATSLTRSSTSSSAGKPSPATPATNRRAWPTAEACPGNHDCARTAVTRSPPWPEPSQSAQVTRAGSAAPRISVPRTSTRRERRSFQPRPRHPGQAVHHPHVVPCAPRSGLAARYPVITCWRCSAGRTSTRHVGGGDPRRAGRLGDVPSPVPGHGGLAGRRVLEGDQRRRPLRRWSFCRFATATHGGRAPQRRSSPSLARGAAPDDPAGLEKMEVVKALIEERFTPIRQADRDGAIAAYEAHNARVRSEVPRDRLVEWRPGDGWGPLSAALGMEEPSEPFPHLNTTSDSGP